MLSFSRDVTRLPSKFIEFETLSVVDQLGLEPAKYN